MIANASEITITGVQSASTADVGIVSFDTRFERGQAGGAPTVIEPGPVTVSVTVSVTYRGE